MYAGDKIGGFVERGKTLSCPRFYVWGPVSMAARTIQQVFDLHRQCVSLEEKVAAKGGREVGDMIDAGIVTEEEEDDDVMGRFRRGGGELDFGFGGMASGTGAGTAGGGVGARNTAGRQGARQARRAADSFAGEFDGDEVIG